MLLGDKGSLKGLHAHMDALSEAKDFIGVNLERRMLVLKWLHIFGYSNRETILGLIDRSDRGGYRFIADLIRHGYIQKLNNVSYSKDLFMLDKKGIGWLMECGIVEKDKPKLPNKRKFIVTDRVLHEVGLHRSVLAVLLNTQDKVHLTKLDKEVRYESLMLDALMFLEAIELEKTGKIAIEYERTNKSRKRIEFLLVEHMKNMSEGCYFNTYFCFTEERLHDYYVQILIDKPNQWSKDKQGKLHNSRPYPEQYNRELIEFCLIDDDNNIERTTVKDVINDKSHRLHIKLAERARKSREDDEKVLKAQKEKEAVRAQIRAEVKEELLPIMRVEIIEELMPKLEKEIEKRLRAEFEEQYSKPKGFFGKMLGD